MRLTDEGDELAVGGHLGVTESNQIEEIVGRKRPGHDAYLLKKRDDPLHFSVSRKNTFLGVPAPYAGAVTGGLSFFCDDARTMRYRIYG